MICILISVKWIYKICQLPGFVNSHSRYDLFQQFQIAPAPFLTLWSRTQEKQLPPTNFCLVVLLFQFVYSPACYRVQKQVLICAFCNHASTVLPNPICAGAIVAGWSPFSSVNQLCRFMCFFYTRVYFRFFQVFVAISDLDRHPAGILWPFPLNFCMHTFPDFVCTLFCCSMNRQLWPCTSGRRRTLEEIPGWGAPVSVLRFQILS